MSRASRPNERALPRWARTAVVVYLSVTVAVVVAALLTQGLELNVDARTKEGLLLAMVVLTLPVSAAYFISAWVASDRPI
ncbi:UNVERIFIED_ORG: multisubunit Na+/H+ antiporter MnhG subunit [Arthrobacter globiformis]|nr:multisubunit Na+/H+ antiporter MnhG subunit [Arthrobacter globiformis]